MTVTVAASSAAFRYPRVLLDVSSSPVLNSSMKVWRQHQDGTRWRVFAESPPVLSGGWAGFDYHAPFNQALKYQVETSEGMSAFSGTVRLVSRKSWLIHPSDPGLSVRIEKLVGPAAPYEYEARAQAFQVLGRRLPVVRTDYPRGGASGQVVVKCESPAKRAAVKALFAEGGPVLLNTTFSADDIGWMWVQPGNLTISNPGGFVDFPFRYATVPFTEVVAPDADQVPQWTFDQMAATFATFDQTTANYDDFRAMQLDIRTP